MHINHLFLVLKRLISKRVQVFIWIVTTILCLTAKAFLVNFKFVATNNIQFSFDRGQKLKAYPSLGQLWNSSPQPTGASTVWFPSFSPGSSYDPSQALATSGSLALPQGLCTCCTLCLEGFAPDVYSTRQDGLPCLSPSLLARGGSPIYSRRKTLRGVYAVQYCRHTRLLNWKGGWF